MNTKIIMQPGSGESSQVFKPVSDINIILEKVTPFAETFRARRGEVLRYHSGNKRTCYLLHSGSVTLNRRGDAMVLNSEHAKFILGVSNQFSQSENLYIRVTENATISRLPLERFNLIVEREALWENLCRLLVYTASRVYEHCTMISQMSSYEIICVQLQELMNESDRIRTAGTAANYIQNRTYLSRSGIMRIIAQLRDAGNITLERGVLTAIHSLPVKS